MNQQKASQCFSDAARLRVPVRDAGVGYTLRMQPKEVNILSDYSASGLDRESETVSIFGSHETRVRGGRHVDAPVTEGICHRRGDVLVQMKGNTHLSGCFFQRLLAQLHVQQRGVILAEFFGIRAIRSQLLLDFLHVIEVVGECDMNISEGDRGDV